MRWKKEEKVVSFLEEKNIVTPSVAAPGDATALGTAWQQSVTEHVSAAAEDSSV